MPDRAGPLMLVASSKANGDCEGDRVLRARLKHLYGQMLLLLSDSLCSVLQRRPGYDLRQLMGGADALLRSQISRSTRYKGQAWSRSLSAVYRDLCFLVECIAAVPLPARLSTRLSQALVRLRPRHASLLFVVLLSGNRLIQLVHPKHRCLPLKDLLLLSTFVGHLDSLRTSDVFTPLCLPAFNSKAGMTLLSSGLI